MQRLPRLLLGSSLILIAPLIALALPASLSLPLMDSPRLCPSRALPSGGVRVTEPAARRVVLVSVDGLRPDAVAVLGPGGAPALHRLRAEGASTHNARTDWSQTVTVPNHASMLTARGVRGACGHGWSGNTLAQPGQTLHTNRGAYIASVFDVTHDAGLQTALFASKEKLAIFDVSYDAASGAPDTTGSDEGPGKLDRFVHEKDTDTLTRRFAAALRASRPGLSVLHLRDPDAKGHGFGWDLSPGSRYLDAVQRADSLVGRLLAAVDADPELSGTTALILTADHGGTGPGHGGASDAGTFTVPFYVWGPGVEAGADLYLLNADTRLDPGTERPGYDDAVQPVRNGDAANLALDLLGLGSVPGSTINSDAAPLRVRAVVNPRVAL